MLINKSSSADLHNTFEVLALTASEMWIPEQGPFSYDLIVFRMWVKMNLHNQMRSTVFFQL